MKCYYSDDDEVSWTQITNIIGYPNITSRLDGFGVCSIKLADMEVGLFATYNALDFVPIKITDDAGTPNIIFKGYLKKKNFKVDSLTLMVSGIGERLQWTPFNKNYILADGLVKTNPLPVTDFNRIVRPNADGATLEWEATGANHYAQIDEDQDDPDTDTYIEAYRSGGHDDSGESELIRFETFTGITAASVDTVVVKIYALKEGVVPDLQVDLDLGGLLGPQNVTLTNNAAWHTITFNGGLNASQADVDGLEVKFTAGALDPDEAYRIFTCYVIVTYDGTHNQGIELTDEDGNAFTWAADQWINEQDVGVLITDNTNDTDSESWECTDADISLIVANGTYSSGDKDSFDSRNDGEYAYYYNEDVNPLTMTITPTIGGVGIADTNVLHSIAINYRFGVRLTPSDRKKEMWLEIEYNGTTWETIAHFVKYTTMTGTKYFEGTHLLEGSDTELAKYLTKTVNDYTSITNIRFRFSSTAGVYSYAYIYIDELTIDVTYYTVDIAPIMEKITDNGASWIICSGLDFSTSGVIGETGADLADGDHFKLGQNTGQILADLFLKSETAFALDTTLTKYIARHYKGVNCYDVLKSICLLEGLHWWEDYTNDQIKIAKEADFVDSTVDLDRTDYDHDWIYNDDCNHYKIVEVYGQASLNIHAFYPPDHGASSSSLMSKTLYDETISTQGDAQKVVNAQGAELCTKRPSIRLTLHGTQEDITVGKTAHITFEKPDGTVVVAQTLYPIRRIDRSKKGIDEIKTVIYAGLGESPLEESLANTIRRLVHLATNAHSARLISTAPTAGVSLSWADIGGADAGARAACLEDDVYGAGWNGDVTHAPTQNAVYDKINAMKEGQTYGYDMVQIIPKDETHYNVGRVQLDAVGEYAYGYFKVHGNVDASADLTFYFVWKCTAADAAVACKKYIGAIKTDKTEDLSHNIHNGTAYNMDSTTADRLGIETFTIGNADFDADDQVHVGIYLNEAARQINLYSCIVRYTYA